MFLDGLEFLIKGGWVMWPLMLCAVVSVAVMIERFIMLRRAAGDTDTLMIKVKGFLVNGQVKEAIEICNKTRGPVGGIIAQGLRNVRLDNAAIERAMEELALREIPVLSKRLGVLDTIITLSPLLGLLGTITGMIQAFHVVAAVQNTSSAGTAITGGVAEALIATATGLSIAIVTLPAYNYLTERVREIIADMETRTTQLLNIISDIKASGGKSETSAS